MAVVVVENLPTHSEVCSEKKKQQQNELSEASSLVDSLVVNVAYLNYIKLFSLSINYVLCTLTVI